MAYYTSRLDENGNEIERRISARSFLHSLRSSLSDAAISSHHRGKVIPVSIRYVNKAAYIEKTPDHSDASSFFSDPKRESDDHSDIVPPLDLHSVENYQSYHDNTYSTRDPNEPARIIVKPDMAFASWLTHKNQQFIDAALRRKMEDDTKMREQEIRRRMAQENYRKWLEKKAMESFRCPRFKIGAKPYFCRRHFTAEETQLKRTLWEHSKRLEQERRRILKRRENVHRQELEEQRRQLAAEAWEKWIMEAKKKPRPVPLNRGFFTLRGTISTLFINPNEWKTGFPRILFEHTDEEILPLTARSLDSPLDNDLPQIADDSTPAIVEL